MHTKQNSLNTLQYLDSSKPHTQSLEQAKGPIEVEVRRNNHILAKEMSIGDHKKSQEFVLLNYTNEDSELPTYADDEGKQQATGTFF